MPETFSNLYTHMYVCGMYRRRNTGRGIYQSSGQI